MAHFPLVATLLILSICSAILGTHSGKPATSLHNQAVAVTQQRFAPIGSLKVLAEGSMSAVQEPFVAVCRDLETYQVLRKLDHNLPELKPQFFDAHAVIVAYLGTRNTGGYGVQIEQKGDPNIDYRGPNRSYLQITEKAPAKGTLVAQVITAPFIAVSVEVSGAPPLLLSLDNAWRQKQQLYRVKSGTFSMGGGLAGVSEQWEPHGELLALRARGLVSFYISIAGTSSNKERTLSDFATGILRDGEITIKKLSSDLFIEGPSGGFAATGMLKDKDSKLSLMFHSLPFIVSDGYGGGGSLEAESVRTPAVARFSSN